MIEQVTDHPLDQLMPLGSQSHQDATARRGGRLADYQRCGFGASQALRDGAGGHQAANGELTSRQLIGRAGTAESAEQVKGGFVDVEPGQGALPLLAQ
nr:hypothetical protein [Nocardia macrotermitis]